MKENNIETYNAKIENTMLGIEDHGILTFFLYLKFGGYGQGFGGYCLDEYNQETKKRVGNKICADFIINILDVLGIEKWEDIKGKYLRIKRNSGLDGKIISIGHIVEDKWFNVSDLIGEK